MNYSEAFSGMDPAEAALGAGILGAALAVFAIGTVIWFFVSALGYYKMFKKAGQRGWMAFIPLLRDFVRFKISWNMKSFVIYLVAVAFIQLASNVESALLGILSIAALIVFIVLEIKVCIRNAKSFGKGTACGVLMFFFPFVVTLILGFGKAEYIGNTTVQAVQEET